MRPRHVLRAAEDHTARALRPQSSPISRVSRWYGGKGPHEVQTSDLSHSNEELNTGPLETLRSKASRRVALDPICASLLCLELEVAKSCKRAGKCYVCPSLR